MNSEDRDLPSLLILNTLPVSSRRFVADELSRGERPAQILERIQSENIGGWAGKLAERKQDFDPRREIFRCHELGIGLISIADEAYPAVLKNIYHPPLVLYVRGTLEASDEKSVAVVGSRHPSFYGLEQAKRFSRSLAENGLTIISGLAKGIDQTAHQAALEIRYGRTIAVLGCGIDQIYPPSSGQLAEKITKQGAVISEYPLGTAPLAFHFPARNRIISGLSKAVLVIEAHSRSGSLITAHEAAEQGKEVFAVPGPVNQLTSRGCHRLIKEGAHLTEDPQEIIEELAPVLLLKKSAAENRFHKAVNFVPQPQISEERPLSRSADSHESEILKLIAAGGSDYDSLLNKSQLTPSEMMVILTRLEMSRRISKQPQGEFIINSMN